MKNLLLYNKLSSLPDDLKNQVEDFIDFLKSKNSSDKTVSNKAKFGSGKGMFVMMPDFDEPLDDFNEYTN